MPEFQLTHIALVGARMDAFAPFGFQDRNQLAMRRVTPHVSSTPLSDLPQGELKSLFGKQLPVWVHNAISDPDFPGREKMLMPLRRFEGELYDSKADEVVASVLSAGFRNQVLDPLNLPESMPLRQRCALVMHIEVWQTAYRRLEEDMVALLLEHASEVSVWAELARNPMYAEIEPA